MAVLLGRRLPSAVALLAAAARAGLVDGGAAAAGAVVEQCPGSVEVGGHGAVSLVAAAWNTPGVPAGAVRSVAGSVLPEMWGRAYFAERCSEGGGYNHTHYSAMKFLGKKLTYTTDVSKGGCGCNAAVYLVSMRQNTEASGCNDYYCDANSVCGPNCAEIDIQEANKYAWHSTLHKSYDGSGVSAGYGGWVHNNNHFDFTAEEYGPGARCVDTSLPFEVATAFPKGADGKLRAMEVTLSQSGRPCSVSMTIDSYQADPGFGLLTHALEEGMTPVVSFWKSSDMLWLDGPGVGGGPCRADTEACDAAPQFYGFSISDI